VKGELTKGRNVQLPAVHISRGVRGAVFRDTAKETNACTLFSIQFESAGQMVRYCSEGHWETHYPFSANTLQTHDHAPGPNRLIQQNEYIEYLILTPTSTHYQHAWNSSLFSPRTERTYVCTSVSHRRSRSRRQGQRERRSVTGWHKYYSTDRPLTRTPCYSWQLTIAIISWESADKGHDQTSTTRYFACTLFSSSHCITSSKNVNIHPYRTSYISK